MSFVYGLEPHIILTPSAEFQEVLNAFLGVLVFLAELLQIPTETEVCEVLVVFLCLVQHPHTIHGVYQPNIVVRAVFEFTELHEP